MHFFHHHHQAPNPASPIPVAPIPVASTPINPISATPIIWSEHYNLPIDSLIIISLAFQTDNGDANEILNALQPLFDKGPQWDTITPYGINHAWRLMKADRHWSIWRAERRVRAYVDTYGDESLKEAGRRQMLHLVPGRNEWDIFTGVSAPRTEEEREMEAKGEWEMEQEKARDGKIGGPTETRNGGPTEIRNGGTAAGYYNGAVAPQTGLVVPATVPATVPANPEANKAAGGGGLVGKMGKLAFGAMMKHHKKKKEQEKVEEYQEEREEEREEEEREEANGESEKEEEEEEGEDSEDEEDDE